MCSMIFVQAVRYKLEPMPTETILHKTTPIEDIPLGQMYIATLFLLLFLSMSHSSALRICANKTINNVSIKIARAEFQEEVMFDSKIVIECDLIVYFVLYLLQNCCIEQFS